MYANAMTAKQIVMTAYSTFNCASEVLALVGLQPFPLEGYHKCVLPWDGQLGFVFSLFGLMCSLQHLHFSCTMSCNKLKSL